MDRQSLEKIKNMIVSKSLDNGINEDVAAAQANEVVAILSKPECTTSYNFIFGLVVVLLMENEQKDAALIDLILEMKPQVMPYLDEERKQKLESLVFQLTDS